MLSGQHSHNEGVPTLFGTNTFQGSVSDDNSFNGSLGGVSPFGTTYSLQGNAIDDYGNFPENTTAAASVSGTQPLLKNFWIDDTRLNIRVGKNRLKYSELGLKLQIMSTVTSVEQAYYDLIYDRENVVVQEKAVELAERLVSENKKRLEVGALAPLDLESAEAQAAQSRAAVIAARSQLSTQENAVKQLITDQYSAWADIVLQPSGTLMAAHQFLSRQDSWKKGLTQRPDFLQSKLNIEKAGIQLKYDLNQVFPELDAFATYGLTAAARSSAARSMSPATGPQVLHLWRQGHHPPGNISARNTYKSDKMTQQQLVLTLKKLEESIMIAIDNDIETIQANYDQVQATTAQRQYGSRAGCRNKKLENGKSTTYTVLQIQRDLTTARGAEIQALDNYNKSLSQFSFLDEGGTLERLGDRSPGEVKIMAPADFSRPRIAVDGKGFRLGGEKFHVKGVAYGPLAPDAQGALFASPRQTTLDMAQIHELGANLLRVYCVPPRWFLDLAEERRLKVFVDIPWNRHLCFDSESRRREARDAVQRAVADCAQHPAVFAFSVANEIPADIVRWAGASAVADFIDDLVGVAKHTDPGCVCTFANFPPTEFLQPQRPDFVCFNVYLHQERPFRNYLARLQMMAEAKPLVLGEFGMDSLREGEARKCETLSWQIENAFRAGLAGAILFSYTDEWFKDGRLVDDWQMGLVTRDRRTRESFGAVRKQFHAAPYFPLARCPKVSVVVASYNAGRTLKSCLDSLRRLNYPDYEVILVDDGSTNHAQIARSRWRASGSCGGVRRARNRVCLHPTRTKPRALRRAQHRHRGRHGRNHRLHGRRLPRG